MRGKTFLVRVLCIILLMTCLSGCSWFGRKSDKEKAEDGPIQESMAAASERSASSDGTTENIDPAAQTGQDTPDPTSDHPEETKSDDSSELSAGTELPEIEISDTANQPVTRNGPQSAQSESTLTESAKTGTPTTAPGSGASQSEAAPASGALQSEAAPASTASQAETTPVPGKNPGNSGSFINENGDTMLPEVP